MAQDTPNPLGPYPHGKATALLAYALDIDSAEAIAPEVLSQLVDEVCVEDTERARLVSALSGTQNPQLPEILIEMLHTRLDRLKNALEMAEDLDAVYGIWGQRTAGGTLLASIGFAVTGIVTGGWAALAVGAGLMAAGGTSLGRDQLKKRTRAARRAVEQTERLLATIERARQNVTPT